MSVVVIAIVMFISKLLINTWISLNIDGQDYVKIIYPAYISQTPVVRFRLGDSKAGFSLFPLLNRRGWRVHRDGESIMRK